MNDELSSVMEPVPIPYFVETPYIQSITKRALSYLRAGFPVNLTGAAGTGKTTLAMHLANKIGRLMVIVHGDEELTTTGLVGGEYGYRIKTILDKFVSRVRKTEEEVIKRWVDRRLAIACKKGYTFIYDEFTRSRPEANNILLAILEEKMLDLPMGKGEKALLTQVHPDFCAIFTSNPSEYAGVFKSQDALRDRMITVNLDAFDYETEVAITQVKSQIPKAHVETIVKIVRGVRESEDLEFAPTVRGAVMIAKILKEGNMKPVKANKDFCSICQDILASEAGRKGSQKERIEIKNLVRNLIDQYS